VWSSPLQLGPAEWFCVGLTHAIVLGIAVFRWVVAPRLRRAAPAPVVTPPR